MFPITDLRGRVIAFGGRALEKDAPAKYLNSPETPLFHKGATLYNSRRRAQAAHKGAHNVVVEGYVDVIAHGDGGLRGRGRAARHGADRRPARAAVEDERRAGALFRRRQRRPQARPIARSISRCRGSSRARASPSRCCRKGRTRTIWCARAAARRWRGDRRGAPAGRNAVAARDRRPAPSIRRNAARRSEARSPRSPHGIGDQTVRKYYRQDLAERSRACSRRRVPRARPRGGGRGERGGRTMAAASAAAAQAGRAGGRPSRPAAYVASPQLATSAIMRGDRTRAPDARGADPAGGAQPSLAAG